MYIPPAFRDDDPISLHATMWASRLSNLVTATPGGLIATPLPFVLDEMEGERGVLYGHVAKANPQWKTPPVGEAMAIFMGPDAYVTPSWYATKPESGMVVPTWNYLAVHAYGPVEFFEDAERLLNVVTRLTKLHEEPRALPWAVSDAPADFIAAQLRGIVGVRMPITRIPMTLGLGPGATGHTVAIILAGCATRSVTIFCGHAVVFLTRPMVKLYGKARRWIERTLAAFFGIAAIGLLPFRP